MIIYFSTFQIPIFPLLTHSAITQCNMSLTWCIKYTLCKTRKLCAMLSAPFALKWTLSNTHCALCAINGMCNTHYNVNHTSDTVRHRYNVVCHTNCRTYDAFCSTNCICAIDRTCLPYKLPYIGRTQSVIQNAIVPYTGHCLPYTNCHT